MAKVISVTDGSREVVLRHEWTFEFRATDETRNYVNSFLNDVKEFSHNAKKAEHYFASDKFPGITIDLSHWGIIRIHAVASSLELANSIPNITILDLKPVQFSTVTCDLTGKDDQVFILGGMIIKIQ